MTGREMDGKIRRSRNRLDKLMALGDVDRCLELLQGMKALVEARIAAEATDGKRSAQRRAA